MRIKAAIPFLLATAVHAAVGDVLCRWLGGAPVLGGSVCQNACVKTGLQAGGAITSSAIANSIDFGLAQVPDCPVPPFLTLSPLANPPGAWGGDASVGGYDGKVTAIPIPGTLNYTVSVSAFLLSCKTDVKVRP
jgi:hypothetical protein